MNTEKAIDWLLETNPNEHFLLWQHMASYAYFINGIDLNSNFSKKIEQVLKKSCIFGVEISKDHGKTLKIAECIKNGENIKKMKKRMNTTRI